MQITCGSRHQKCILFNYELLLFPLESDIPALFTKISSCPKALIVSLIKCSGNCGSVTSPDNNVLSINCYKDSAPTRNRDGLSSIRANSSCNFFGLLCLSVRSDKLGTSAKPNLDPNPLPRLWRLVERTKPQLLRQCLRPNCWSNNFTI
mgnify:CR=1 FL=1